MTPFRLTILSVFAIILVTFVHSKSVQQQAKQNEAEPLDHNFMPSHQILWRRNDQGELLLPSVDPFTGPLEARADENAATSTNIFNNYQSKPAYGAPEEKPTCLIRTCDQYVTGRDLTYTRALEIVQNEEYLVAVDANLIRRRQDYGESRNVPTTTTSGFGTSWNLQPVSDAMQLTQYLATLGKRKKRSTVIKEPKLLFNYTTTGFGTVDYDWRTVLNDYVRFGAATALLLGLTGIVPSPAEPIMPIELPELSASRKVSQVVDEIPSRAYQVYQEDAPARRRPSKTKLADNVLLKRVDSIAPRIDLFSMFRRRRRPNRQRPGIPPKGILKPVVNTKREVAKAPKATQKVPETVVSKDEMPEPETIDLGDFEDKKNPFLTDSKFKEFFPSWTNSRKKRHTRILEGRIFNITTSGFGTISYDWRQVINQYVGYGLTAGLILLASTVLTTPENQKPLIPLNLPELGDARINPSNLPPNLPPGLVPPGNPQPGTPGGGGKPIGNTRDAQEALALIPRGTVPVTVFPPYATPRTVPAVSVIFLETATPRLVRRQGSIWDSMGSGIDSLARNYNCIRATLFRKKRSPNANGGYGAPECDADYSNLRYGFRTRVTLVENQSCILDVTCTATGDKINVALARRSGNLPPQPHRRRHKRQAGEEFRSDAPPECRAIRDPNEACLNYYQTAV